MKIAIGTTSTWQHARVAPSLPQLAQSHGSQGHRPWGRGHAAHIRPGVVDERLGSEGRVGDVDVQSSVVLEGLVARRMERKARNHSDRDAHTHTDSRGTVGIQAQADVELPGSCCLFGVMYSARPTQGSGKTPKEMSASHSSMHTHLLGP